MLILQAKENTICVWKALAKKKQKEKRKNKVFSDGKADINHNVSFSRSCWAGLGFRFVGGHGGHMSANRETEWNKGFKMPPEKS